MYSFQLQNALSTGHVCNEKKMELSLNISVNHGPQEVNIYIHICVWMYTLIQNEKEYGKFSLTPFMGGKTEIRVVCRIC